MRFQGPLIKADAETVRQIEEINEIVEHLKNAYSHIFHFELSYRMIGKCKFANYLSIAKL